MCMVIGAINNAVAPSSTTELKKLYLTAYLPNMTNIKAPIFTAKTSGITPVNQCGSPRGHR